MSSKQVLVYIVGLAILLIGSNILTFRSYSISEIFSDFYYGNYAFYYHLFLLSILPAAIASVISLVFVMRRIKKLITAEKK